MEQNANNKIILRGKAVSEPVFSHEVFGESFYSFEIEIKRLSGQTDILPVMISERLIFDGNITAGRRYYIEGQLRSYNIMEENKSRLQLRTFAKEIYSADEEEEDINVITLDGFICKTPVYRVTPFSREIADVLIAVNRSYGKSDYIPTICWGRNARYCQHLNVGEAISVEGRLQSREYQKKLSEDNIVNRIAFEVSISKMNVEKKDV